MSRWSVCVVDGNRKHLSHWEDDYTIESWEWVGDALVAIIPDLPAFRIVQRGTATGFLLTCVDDKRRTILASFRWNMVVCEGYTVQMAEAIMVTGDLIWLIEEYIPDRPYF